jgi:hypothetical protein
VYAASKATWAAELSASARMSSAWARRSLSATAGTRQYTSVYCGTNVVAGRKAGAAADIRGISADGVTQLVDSSLSGSPSGSKVGSRAFKHAASWALCHDTLGGMVGTAFQTRLIFCGSRVGGALDTSSKGAVSDGSRRGVARGATTLARRHSCQHSVNHSGSKDDRLGPGWLIAFGQSVPLDSRCRRALLTCWKVPTSCLRSHHCFEAWPIIRPGGSGARSSGGAINQWVEFFLVST